VILGGASLRNAGGSLTRDAKSQWEDSTRPPVWGNCRRGCPPSYLDQDGYCSPACHLGAPRGEFVTIPKELVIVGAGKSD
jgi:hypothetical protein